MCYFHLRPKAIQKDREDARASIALVRIITRIEESYLARENSLINFHLRLQKRKTNTTNNPIE